MSTSGIVYTSGIFHLNNFPGPTFTVNIVSIPPYEIIDHNLLIIEDLVTTSLTPVAGSTDSVVSVECWNFTVTA